MSTRSHRLDQGEVVEWSDERRCGFILPRDAHASNEVVFLSLREMADRRRPPKVGDTVLYRVEKVDPEPGRRLRTTRRETGVTFLGEEAPSGGDSRPGPFMALGLLHLVLLTGASVAFRQATWALVVALLLSAYSIVQYAWDKRAAGQGARRIRENDLHFVALLGGWPGAALAQRLFRHKTRKVSFQATFALAVAVNVVIVYGALGWLVLRSEAL